MSHEQKRSGRNLNFFQYQSCNYLTLKFGLISLLAQECWYYVDVTVKGVDTFDFIFLGIFAEWLMVFYCMGDCDFGVIKLNALSQI